MHTFVGRFVHNFLYMNLFNKRLVESLQVQLCQMIFVINFIGFV